MLLSAARSLFRFFMGTMTAPTLTLGITLVPVRLSYDYRFASAEINIFVLIRHIQ